MEQSKMMLKLIYQALEDKIKEYNPALDAQRLFRAFTYADNAHAGQLRKDGSPYITHPLAVAEIVAELELDTDSIIAALLHDCIEDTGATHEEIAKLFGPTVADLGGGGHQADPGAVHLQGRGADGEPAQDAHGHGQRASG